MFNVQCSVCLEFSDLIKTVNDTDENNSTDLSKLQFISPEIEWMDYYVICRICSELLNKAFSFKEMCFNLESQRKTIDFQKIQDENYLIPIETDDFLCSDIYEENICENVQESEKAKQVDELSCFYCKKNFKEEKKLSRHIESVHQKTCTICDNNFHSNNELKKHTEETHGESQGKGVREKFSCEKCDLKFVLLKEIIQHCIVEHSMTKKDIKPYTCELCDSRFSTSTCIIQHKKYHQESRPHICSFCGNSFKTKSDLTVHERTHYNRRNYKCDICLKAFNTNKNLRTHHLVVHTEPTAWKFECAQCLKRFPLKSNFEQHVKRHAGNKQFFCHVCAKCFVSRDELKRHHGFHANVRPFKCVHCQKDYREKRSLEYHLFRVHDVGEAKGASKEKKFACHVCPSRFFSQQKLTRHLCTHSGVKPFSCYTCDKKFIDKSYLKQHLKKTHGVFEENAD